MTMKTDYHRALPIGDVKERDEAEFKANGFFRPELREIGYKMKHEIYLPDGITLVAETQPSGDPAVDYRNLKRHRIGAQYRDVTAVERDILERDIATNGIRKALVLLDDAVFDGWQRYVCGQAVGYDFTAGDFVRYFDVYGEADPVAVADSLNLARRHLTADEITRRLERRIAAAKAEHEAVAGKPMPHQAVAEMVRHDVEFGVVRKSHNGDVRKSRQYARQANAVADAIPAVDELLESNRLTNSDVASVANVETEDIAAAAALVAEGQARTLKQGVRRSRMERERTAHAHHTDEEFDEREKADTAGVDAGLPTPRAALPAEGREQRQGADAERHRADTTRRSSGSVELHHAGIAELRQHVAAGSVDIIYTDTADEPGAVPLYYADLGRFAAHALKDGGLLLVLGGAMYLPQLYRQLEGADIQYRWQFVYSTPGVSTPMGEPRVHQNCRVLVAHSKGAYTGEWHADLVTMPGEEEQEGQLRRWQQQAAGTIYALGRFVAPGLTVCDPMMGSGTTGVASLALGCAFIGSDSDPDCVTRVRNRIDEARKAADGRPRPEQPPIPRFAETAIRIISHGESGLLAEPAS